MKKIKTKIERKLKRKTNPDLVETIIACKKNSAWLNVAHLISIPARKQVALNLRDINAQVKDNQTVIIPGKVLSSGSIDKKIEIAAFSFSSSAVNKLKKLKIEYHSILEEVKKNPEARDIIILTKRILRVRQKK